MVRFVSAIRAYLKGPRHYVLLSVFSTALFLLVLFSFPALLLWGLGYPVDYLGVIGLMVATTFVMYFSPTPGAAGVAEGIFALFLSDLVSTGDLVLVVIAWRALTVYLGMLIGVPVTAHLLATRARK